MFGWMAVNGYLFSSGSPLTLCIMITCSSQFSPASSWLHYSTLRQSDWIIYYIPSMQNTTQFTFEMSALSWWLIHLLKLISYTLCLSLGITIAVSDESEIVLSSLTCIHSLYCFILFIIQTVLYYLSQFLIKQYFIVSFHTLLSKSIIALSIVVIYNSFDQYHGWRFWRCRQQ